MYCCPLGCDGYCGPNNGCGCTSCRAQDEAEGILPFVHRATGKKTNTNCPCTGCATYPRGGLCDSCRSSDIVVHACPNKDLCLKCWLKPPNNEIRKLIFNKELVWVSAKPESISAFTALANFARGTGEPVQPTSASPPSSIPERYQSAPLGIRMDNLASTVRQQRGIDEGLMPSYWQLARSQSSQLSLAEFLRLSMRVVDVSSSMRSSMQQLMTRSCKTEDLGHGRDVQEKQKKYNHLEVVKVSRIENPAVWHSYSTRRELLIAQADYDERIAVHTMNCVTNEWMAGCGLRANINEVYLWHGTKYNFVDDIEYQSFEEPNCSPNGLYGAGIYFGNYLFFFFSFYSPPPKTPSPLILYILQLNTRQRRINM